MIFRIFTTLMLIAVVAGSMWLGGQQRETVVPVVVDGSSADLGYSARKAILVETGPDGLPIYVMNADVIHQRPADGVDFEQVQMTFRDEEGRSWNARADHGELGQDSAQIELTGAVRVDGILPGTSDAAWLTTEKLDVDTRTEQVSTAEPVTLDWAGRQLKSRGLTANLKDRHLQLKSSVHGTFAP